MKRNLPAIPDNSLEKKIEFWGQVIHWATTVFKINEKSEQDFRYFMGCDPFDRSSEEQSKSAKYIWDIEKQEICQLTPSRKHGSRG